MKTPSAIKSKYRTYFKTRFKNYFVEKTILISFSLLAILPINAQNISSLYSTPFNDEWKFSNSMIKYAEKVDFDDSRWTAVNLPHDWSIEDLPNQIPDTVVGPFSRYSIGKAFTGWTVGGIGWYRKKFVSNSFWKDKLVSIHFDGVYMNSDVWLNGYHLGNRPYGYVPFYYDLTPYLKPIGQENVLVVRVKNEGRNSRWYSGSGIYRQVCLVVTEPIHVDKWGVSITTPKVSKENASIQINTTINNKQLINSHVNLQTIIVSSNGEEVGRALSDLTLEPEGKEIVTQNITLSNPTLWSINMPNMYKAVTEIKENNKLIDRVYTPFGIRSIQFDPEKGFLLNGERVLLKGGCVHHDNGPLGAVSLEKAEERKIKILKKNGFNAIRTSHNPASKALLDVCDRLGMLVIDEAFDTWLRPKNKDDYNLYFNEWWQKDLEAMILGAQNHPSIIMWSIGNEIYEAPDYLGAETANRLVNKARQLDPTRPVTAGIVYFSPYTKQPWENYAKHLAHLDIDGYNYFLESKSPFFQRDKNIVQTYDSEHAKNPHKVFYGSETLSQGALENWNKTEESPYVLGCFKWTAFDYIGEAGIGKSRYRKEGAPAPSGMAGLGLFAMNEWPIYNAYCGDFDLIGNKKNSSFYQDVVWRNSSIELLVHQPLPEGMLETVSGFGFPEVQKSWTWPGQEGKKMKVYVYTRSEKVKLELNGKVVAEKNVPEGSITVAFEVEYQPGTLVAKSFDNEKQTGSSILSTTGKPTAIRLIADQHVMKANRTDLCYVGVEVIDRKGNVVPYVNDLEINFQLAGDVEIAAVGNGSASDMSSFQQPRKKVFQGRALVILKPKGKVGNATLKAKATGLKEGVIELKIND